MSTLNVTTANVSTLSGVTQIRDTGGTTRLQVNTSEPVLSVGSAGGNLIKARNTAKWWIQTTSYAGISNSYGVSSLTDLGASQIRINYATPSTNGLYAVASSLHHFGGVTWQLIMNYPGTPSTTSITFRFHYGPSGVDGNPTGGWGAIGFGDQA